MSVVWSLSGEKRTWHGQSISVANDPERTRFSFRLLDLFILLWGTVLNLLERVSLSDASNSDSSSQTTAQVRDLYRPGHDYRVGMGCSAHDALARFAS
jgi:hypothetical protein